MENYWTKSVSQLKEFVKQNNIQMGEPSGKYGSLIKTDYLEAIKTYLYSLASKSIIKPILCEWLLMSSTDKCRRPQRARRFVRYTTVPYSYGNIYIGSVQVKQGH